VELFLDKIPVLEGVEETMRAGIFSSLQPQNLRLRRAIGNLEDVAQHPRFPILFDPQTAGGLLAGLPASESRQCLEELKRRGYAHAAKIGEVKPRVEEDGLVLCRHEKP
jgi:selenide,water dikinase